MSYEELVSLTGGSEPEHECCVCINNVVEGRVMGYMAASNQTECEAACSPCGWIGTYGPWTYCQV